MANLYVANSNVLGGSFEHLYLVYDPQGDFDPNSSSTWNNDVIIRGGPQGIPQFSPIQIENGFIITASEDALNGDHPITDRNYTSLSGNAASLWASMTVHIDTLGTQDSNGYILTETTYETTEINSNSVINTALNHVGIDLRDVAPQAMSNYPGHLGLLDGSGNDAYTAFSYPSSSDEYYFVKYGGGMT